MQIPKAMIVERIRSASGHDAAEKADKELPDKVDLQTDADKLKDLGLDPGKLADDFGGQSPVAG
ncbi:Hypothetical Protein RradSPS_0591 [Rubrobacter radiotolerans]|uniref:Uncharacterized protein n=1 Tax=Rubrobacter radiotolerans TaxID=42256 RepID=A0A023X1D1_RUBRA|nr:hypothetical protein [Rubrobacter radiotolerans]AHY45874.1 Hypothetical Protein RradSPS_0591 [Rubrobacter radiotolerans]MDX5893287.1 hypothetical protein [Rubrobacter radiotolerans]SMC03429.1 hypothetical protein SAMN00767673_0591 [Rubrobacter radiotolerans DSM 5868]